MTVSTQENIVKYQGNPSTTVYQIPFRWLEDTDINIKKQLQDGTVEVLTYLTDYTLTGENDEHGGYATFTVAPLETDTIVIQRIVPYTQETDYEENEIFPADSHEEALDKLTMEVQQLAEESSRSLKISVFSTVDPEDVINHVERVYKSIDNIDGVAKDLPNVDTVAENINSVNTTARDIDSVVTTATNIEDVKTVAQNKASLNITAANISNVNTVAKDITNVITTAASIESVNTNATNIVDINTNAANIGSINQVAEIRNNVTLVALNNRKVTTVADNMDNITTVVDNITDINNAHANAQEAKQSAANAKQSELNAKESETNAASSEDKAKVSETNAKQSENSSKEWSDKAKYYYEHSQTLGDIVQLTPTVPVKTVTFEKKCSEKQFLSIYVDRVKLLPEEYTLAEDGMSVTLTQEVTDNVPVEVSYMVGMSNTVAEDLQKEIAGIAAKVSSTAVTIDTDQTITANKNFTGTVTVTTQPNTDSSTKVATTEYVKNVLDEASPTNMVTTDTVQTITGSKTFDKNLTVSGNVNEGTTTTSKVNRITIKNDGLLFNAEAAEEATSEISITDVNNVPVCILSCTQKQGETLADFNIKLRDKNGNWVKKIQTVKTLPSVLDSRVIYFVEE